MSNRIAAYTFLTIGAALSIFLVALAILCTGIIISIIFWSFGIVAGVFTVKFGILPLLATGTEVYIKLREHNARMHQFSRFALIEADENGNYSQVLDTRTGQVIYLRPGNPGVPMQIAGPRYDYDIEAEAEEVPELEGPAGIDPATASAPTFQEELQAGALEAGQPFIFGYRLAFDPFQKVYSLEPVTDAHKKTLFLAGWSGMGKSTLLAGAMARRARTQPKTAFLVFDPHKGADEDSLAVQLLPAFNDWLITPKGGANITGKKPAEVKAAVNFLNEQIELRLYRDDLTPEQKRQISPFYDLDIWVIVDECLSYVRETRIPGHDKAFDQLAALLQTIATDTRKGGITGVYMTQLTAKDQLGQFEIKDACPNRLVLASPKDQGKALGLTEAEAKQCELFAQGRGYWKAKNGMEVFLWGYVSPEEIAGALEGSRSPLIPEWKQGGNNLLQLHSRQPRTAEETSRKRDGNEIVNKFPAALQAALEDIPNWQQKMEILEAMIGGDRRDIWQALFGRAPGGRTNGGESAQYDVLVEAIRWRYQQLKQA
jgi:hypothetical protein